MKQVNAVEFGKNYVLVRYTDDTDPPWVAGRELAIDWRKASNAERLAHVGYQGRNVGARLAQSRALIEASGQHHVLGQRRLGRQ